MPFSLDRYSDVRPFLYHLTARENIEHVKTLKQLQSAAASLNAAGEEETLRVRRNRSTPVLLGSEQVVLRDQMPLHEGNVKFLGGWTLEDLVEDLNRRVFFWSGWKHRPKEHGVNHFYRYQSESSAILRVRFEALREYNAESTPYFCKYNSGAPRCFGGRGSPRGPDTFLPADCCPYNPRDVVEVTFLELVKLPDDTEVSNHVTGPWTPLFAGA